MIARPAGDEYGEFYSQYISLVPGDDALAALRDGEAETAALLRSLDPELADHAYGPGKWTLAQVAQHLVDTEIVFSYRALRIARGDQTPLPGYEQDGFAATAPRRTLAQLADSAETTRAWTLDVLGSLTQADLARIGTASGAPLSARAAAWITAGHERHHLSIVRERYLER